MFNLKILIFTIAILICNILYANSRPEWFIPPPLDPTGLELETVEIDDGVFLIDDLVFALDDLNLGLGENTKRKKKDTNTQREIFHLS